MADDLIVDRHVMYATLKMLSLSKKNWRSLKKDESVHRKNKYQLLLQMVINYQG